jgi:hypothetical protein
MKQHALAIAALVLMGGPTLAEDFYVVQDSSTKKCTVVSEKPTSTTTTIVSSSGTIYKSRQEAESGMKTITVCSSN